MKWLILASWWAQGALHWVQGHHWSRGLECEPCMVRRALGDHDCIRFPEPHDSVRKET